MQPDPSSTRLERHALVMAVWLPVGFLALWLFHYGFNAGGAWFVAAGFGTVLTGFGAHVIVNWVCGTTFAAREVALGLVLFGVSVVALILAVLFDSTFAARFLWPVALGLIGLAAVVVVYMVTRFGTRGAFLRFDIIRDNNPRDGSQLTGRFRQDRGGRK